MPRLRTIERYLLFQLAAVRRELERVEHGPPAQTEAPAPRWCLIWRRAPAGQPRVGILHTPACMLATGETVDARAIAEARRHPGRRVEPCDVCNPPLP